MAMSKGTNTYNRQMWEDAEFPILCQTCLGDNPYIRMTKEKYGKECKICNRPFTVFRWCPGLKMRFKKTEICQTCAKLKNVCQTCLLDLEYGLPIQLRDMALKVKDDLPRSDVNKEYFIQNISGNEELASVVSSIAGAGNKSDSNPALLTKLARSAPYYKRNRPHICSFWVRGNCKRGEECPYRHEKPSDPDDPLSDQNIRDRYYGVNDPVAMKLMKRAEVLPKLEIPDDKTITTLYMGNVSPNTTETELQNIFYQFGEIRNISVVPRQQCAFVEFVKRADAELAAQKTFNNLTLDGRKIHVNWGHSQGKKEKEGEAVPDALRRDMEPTFVASANLPSTLPPLPKHISNDFFNLAQSSNILVQPPPLPPPMPYGMAPPLNIPPPPPAYFNPYNQQ